MQYERRSVSKRGVSVAESAEIRIARIQIHTVHKTKAKAMMRTHHVFDLVVRLRGVVWCTRLGTLESVVIS